MYEMNTTPLLVSPRKTPPPINDNFSLNNNEAHMEHNYNNHVDEIKSQIRNDFQMKKMYSYRRPFSKMKRKIIFFLIFIINVLINVDHGAIPAGTTELKKENNLDNVELGIIGSLVYLGLVLGSISAGPIFASYSSKWVVILSLLFSCFFLYCFTFIKGGWGMAFCRVGCGFCQVFCYIYFPVWVDQFGVNKSQTIWLTFLQLGVPVGTMLGYVMEALFIKKFGKWKYAFYTQIFFIVICVVVFILTPDKFFSRNYKHSETSQEEIENEVQNMKEALEKDSKTTPHDKYKLRNVNALNALIHDKYERPSLYSIFSMIDDTEEEGTQKYISVLRDLVRNKKYILTMFGISSLLFVVTGIQFWISDYMQEVMLIPSSKVYITYAVICITAPVLGVLLGGFFIQYLGGYTDKRALDACYKIAIVAACCGIFLPFVDIIWVFVILMWLLLFFGGSITPGLTGIMLSSIPDNSKEIGNSVTQLCYNLLGYLPSPFLYGLVCKYTGGTKSRYGLGVILLWAYFGVIALFFAKRAQDSGEDDGAKKINSDTMEEKSNILTSLFGRLSLK